MKISIITATYNNERNILKTVESVLVQDFRDYEIIIVDNCSSDKTLEIIRKFNSDRIRIFSESDSGIYNAFNKGIFRSNGDIIAFLNSGDFYLPDVLCRVNALFEENSDVDCIHGNITVKGRDVISPSGVNSLDGNRIFHPATFMRRSIFQGLKGFNEKYKIVSDLDLFIRARKAGFKFKYIDEPFTDFELGGKSTENRLATIKETVDVLNRNNFPFHKKLLFIYKEYAKYFFKKICTF